jgi:hypothetical protein
MVETKRGLGGAAGVLALGLAAAGCGSDISAGSESHAVNLGRCFGANCQTRAQALSGTPVEASPCGALEGPLEDVLLFESIGENEQLLEAKEAADGSVWALANLGYQHVNLAHFSSDGELLEARVVAELGENTNVTASLAIDSSGAVTVGIYSIFAENADSDLIEELELSRFDARMAELETPRRFRGMASPHLFGGAAGSVWLAGNADANAPHGVVSRLTSHEPDWIQTQVPSAGQGVLGVSGLTVADDGTAAVIASLSPRWNGGPNVMKVGVSTFNAAGNPKWTLELPGDYAGGYPPAIGGSGDGALFVAGVIDDGKAVSVRGLSPEGDLRFAYELSSSFAELDVRRSSGRVFVRSSQGLAVIDSEGTSCRQFSIVLPEAAPEPAEPWQANRDYVLDHSGSLIRYRIPE